MSLRADVDSILEMRRPEPETAPIELPEDTVLISLFSVPTAPLEPCECAKRHCSSRTIDGDDTRARNKERTLIDEETR